MKTERAAKPAITGRRNFISTLAAAGLSIPFVRLAGHGFPVSSMPGGRIHVFSKPLVWLGYDDLAAILADAGADGIDLTIRPQGHVLPENAARDLPKAIDAARKHGLKVEMIVTSILSVNEKYTGEIIRTAASSGVKYYRLGWYSFDEKEGITGSIKKCHDELTRLAEMNSRYGIQGAYQNHAGLMVGAAAWDIYEMMHDLDPNYIGCQYDIRHAVAEGSGSWPNGLKLLARWIRCFDIKDFRWQESNGKWNPVSVPLGEGMVNFDQYFQALRQLGLNGPMSLHFEYPPFENDQVNRSDSEKRKLFLTAMKRDIDKLRSYCTRYGF